MTETLFLAVAAFAAGLVDAVVGGGGLIQIPALFTAFPQSAAATLFGTNKVASICGTSVATYRYAKSVKLNWRVLAPAFGAALIFAFLGAGAVSLLPKAVVRPVVLVLLIVVALYTFAKKDFGQHHRPRLQGRSELWAAAGLGAALGFYDGFFGPGTGAFLIFLYIRLFGYDFLSASASAKFVNFATNLAALAFFIPNGNVLWAVAGVMAVCNVAGSIVGSRLALQRGTGFVRVFFLVILTALIAKFSWDTAKPWLVDVPRETSALEAPKLGVGAPQVH